MIAALILAAGQSKRMGQPKMLLPWGKTTVLGKVIETIQHTGMDEILVVTGGAREQVERIVVQYAIRSVHNPDFANGEMLSSLQTGLRALIQPPPDLPHFLRKWGRCHEVTEGVGVGDAALVCLGDQPQVEERTVRLVVDSFIAGGSHLVVPSYRMRRGHPWLVARPLWDEILQMQPPQSPRDFLNRHASEIEYINVETPSILADLDTPDDYLKSRP